MSSHFFVRIFKYFVDLQAKMPVNGLPKVLECLINTILEESQLASYKFAGNLQRTTLVLRFDAMADTRVLLPTHHSSPAPVNPRSTSFRPKSPSQIRRDNQRLQQFRSSFSMERTPERTPMPDVETKINMKTTTNDLSSSTKEGTATDSGIHNSTSVLEETPWKGQQTKNSHATQIKVMRTEQKPVYVAPTQQNDTDAHVFEPDYKNLKNNIDESIDETETPCETQTRKEIVSDDVEETKIIDSQATGADGIYTKTPCKEPKTQKEILDLDLDLDLSDEVVINVLPCHKNKQSNEEIIDTSDCDVTHESDENTSSIKSTHDAMDSQEASEWEEDILNILRFEKAIGKHIVHANSQHVIKKVVLNHRTSAITVETDDIIIEYCRKMGKILHFFPKNGSDEDDSPYESMQKRRLRDWINETQRLQKDSETLFKKFRTQLTKLYRHIVERRKRGL